MTQSTDSNLWGIPAFWPNHTAEPPTDWTNWIDQFHLAIIVKDTLDIDNLKEPLESETTISILESAQDSENRTQRKTREARNKELMQKRAGQMNFRRETKTRGDEEKRSRQE